MILLGDLPFFPPAGFSSVVMFLQPAGLVGLIVALPSALPLPVIINSLGAVCGCVFVLCCF